MPWAADSLSGTCLRLKANVCKRNFSAASLPLARRGDDVPLPLKIAVAASLSRRETRYTAERLSALIGRLRA